MITGGWIMSEVIRKLWLNRNATARLPRDLTPINLKYLKWNESMVGKKLENNNFEDSEM